MNQHDIRKTIRICADSLSRDAGNLCAAPIIAGDDVKISVLLKSGNRTVAPEDVSKVSIAIFDIGEINSPEPRNVVPLLFADATVKTESDAESEEILSHATFELTASQTSALKVPKAWAEIYAYDINGARTTFMASWIDVRQNRGDKSDPSTLPDPSDFYLKFSQAEAAYAKKSQNLSDLEDISLARENLSIYSKEESDSIVSVKADNIDESRTTTAKNVTGAINELNEKLKLKADLEEIENTFSETNTSISEIQNSLSTLERRAQSSGNFHCLYAYVQTPAFALTPPFTFCSTVEKDFTGKIFSKGNLSLSINSTRNLELTCNSGYGTSQVLPERAVALSVSVSENGIYVREGSKLLIRFNTCNFEDNPESGLRIASVSSLGHLSRIKLFNFAFEDSQLGYGATEYSAGFEEPTHLKAGAIPYTSSMQLPAIKYFCEVSYTEDSTIIKVNNEDGDTSRYGLCSFSLPFPVKAGSHVQFLGNMQNIGRIRLVPVSNVSETQAGLTIYPPNEVNNNICLKDYNAIFLRTTNANAGTVKESILENCMLKVDGALMSLSDSLDVIQIRDLSGNGKHAAAPERIFAQKNSNPAIITEKISWAGTCTTQQLGGDNAYVFARNSISSVYAKPDSSSSFDFVCGDKSFPNIALEAGTMTKVAEYICGNEPQTLTITPSGNTNYTGNLELSIIENITI